MTQVQPTTQSEVTQSQESVLSPIKDVILHEAWVKMKLHDQQAKGVRERFRKDRKRLIFLTTIGSVFATLALGLSTSQHHILFTVTAVLGLALPALATVFIRTRIAQFSNLNDWLDHRVITERLRSTIFLYRTNAGIYQDVDHPHLRDDLLALKITESTFNLISSSSPALTAGSYEFSPEEQAKFSKLFIDQKIEDPLTFESYLKERCEGQIIWYSGKIKDDYGDMVKHAGWASWLQLGGLILPTFFLLLGAPGYIIGLSAIGNAVALGHTSWINVISAGRVYGLYSSAVRQLVGIRRNWTASLNNPEYSDHENRKAFQLKIIKEVEGILSNEVEEWYQIIYQGHSTSDQELFQSIENDFLTIEKNLKNKAK